MRSIELLSPAKNTNIGIEAIRHGADAVYIGAPRFGARAAAGNSVEDIARLVEYAHLFKARVYVTVNTIIYDDELKEVESLIWKLWEIKVDALIIQDLRILSLNLPPIPLHASTQMDNHSAEKVKMLSELGFPQVVLARELTVEQIAEIHKECPDTELEVFVHGALCVGLSGRCNASEALFRRSANRGECAQVCRMKFDLLADGKTIVKGKHLLSIKDNCQINNLEALLQAGATSLKIEGRLKDADYVKNVTAAYSNALNAIIARHPNSYCRASSGHISLSFEPNVMKSFNRGFVKSTNRPDANFDTPKSLGEPIDKHTELHNGDGLCYIEKGELVGCRVNNAETFRFPNAKQLYRNQDQQFDKLLSKPSSNRHIYVDIEVRENGISMTDEDGITATIATDAPTELAHTHQTDNIKRQLSKLGDTIFEARKVDVLYRKNYFIPSSILSAWRRELASKLIEERLKFYPQMELPHSPMTAENNKNIASMSSIPYELTHDADTPLMLCKHCIRRSLGICLREGGKPQLLQLKLDNGSMFDLEFDCKECVMKVRQNKEIVRQK